MKLKKQLAVLLAASLAVTLLPGVNTVKAGAEEAETQILEENGAEEETQTLEENGAEEGTQALEKNEAEEEGIQTLEENKAETGEDVAAKADSTQEDNITITGLTTASTYYSLYGKFPMYIEYSTKEDITNVQYGKISMDITKEDGTLVASAKSEYNSSCFYIDNCSGVESGQSYKLKFTIKYNYPNSSSPREFKEVWSDTKEITFADKKVWLSNKYCPSGTKNSDGLELCFEGVGSEYYIDKAVLLDNNGEVAACSYSSYDTGKLHFYERYDNRYEDEGIFKNDIDVNKMGISSCSLHLRYTREIKPGEELYLAYYIDGKEYKPDNVTCIATDNPYISYAGLDGYCYPGMENAVAIKVTGYNIDFNRLSFVLKEKDTGRTAAASVNQMTKIQDKEQCYYCVEFAEGEQFSYKKYNIEYSYSDSEKEIIVLDKDNMYIDLRSKSIIWNPKEKTLEYYNHNIPVNSTVSYHIWEDTTEYTRSVRSTSGEAETNSQHIITIPLEDEVEESGLYNFSVTYTDSNGNKQTEREDQSICIMYYDDNNGSNVFNYLNNIYYLSDNEKYGFSVIMDPKDKDMLNTTCNAEIYNMTDGIVTGSINLELKEEGGNLLYSGFYNGNLQPGSYSLSFSPLEDDINLYFYVQDSSKLCITGQSYELAQKGTMYMLFPTAEIANKYFKQEDLQKIEIKVCDIAGNQTAIYKYQEDFSITNTENNLWIVKFKDEIKEKLAKLYYSYFYIYYNGEEIRSAVMPGNPLPGVSIYESGHMEMGMYVYTEPSKIYMNDNYSTDYGTYDMFNSPGYYPYNDLVMNDYYNRNSKYKYGLIEYCGVDGKASAFPAKLKITEWHSMETIKEIDIPEAGYKLTSSDLEGLSDKRIYNCFLEGADGSVNSYRNYLALPKDNTGGGNTGGGNTGGGNTGGGNTGGGNTGGGNTGGGNTGGSLAPYIPPVSTEMPSQTPAAGTASQTPSAAPSQTPSSIPSQTPSAAPAQTTVPPEPPVNTDKPEGTSAPLQTQAPENKPSQTPSGGDDSDKTGSFVKEGKKIVSGDMEFKSTGDGNVTISDIDTKNTKNIVIPATIYYNGIKYKVTQVGKSAFEDSDIKSVVLGKNIVTIGKEAFKNCINLDSVKLGNNVKEIGDRAFKGCKKLETIKFPYGVKTIGKGSFRNCINLKKAEIPGTVTNIVENAFRNCRSMETFIIGTENDNNKKLALRYGLTTAKVSIGASALENCTELRSVVINTHVTKIGNSTFKFCNSLREMIIKSLKLKKVGGHALKGVHNCKITVPPVKLKPYTVLFKNKGQGKKVIVAKG